MSHCWNGLRQQPRVFAPSLLPYELANIAVMKARRLPEASAIIAHQLSAANCLPIQLVTPDFGAVYELAGRFRLTAYDAAYLWLALQRNDELLTLDQALSSAWSGARQT